MSLVVAIKEKDKVYFGSDSQVLRVGSNSCVFNKNNFRIWKIEGVDDCIMAAVGPLAQIQCIKNIFGIVRKRDVFYNDIDFEYVVKRIVPLIRHEFIKANFIEDDIDQTCDCKFLFAYKNKIWEIHYDGCVIEIEDFIAIGSGEDLAVGSLVTSSKSKNTVNRIVNAIKSSATHDIFTEYPIVITDTESREFKIISKEEADKISKEKK